VARRLARCAARKSVLTGASGGVSVVVAGIDMAVAFWR
jgi:hypothetical protein